MTRESAVKDLREDEICNMILKALNDNDLTYDQIMALGDNPRQIATRLEMLQATGIIEAFFVPHHPSTCSYRMAVRE